MSKQTPESNLMESLCEYLSVKGYFFIRVNNIPVYDTVRKFYRAMPKYSMKGVSDIILFHNGKGYCIEAKVKGNYQSPEQKDFQLLVEESGNIYILARSIDDLINYGF